MSQEPRGFDARTLEERYRFLDSLPEGIFEKALTNPHGHLSERVEGILSWRSSLLAGHIPDWPAARWPAPLLFEPLHKELDNLGIARFCKQQGELTEALLLSILNVTAEANKHLDESLAAHTRRLREQEFERLRKQQEEEQRREQDRKRAANPGKGSQEQIPAAKTGQGKGDAKKSAPGGRGAGGQGLSAGVNGTDSPEKTPPAEETPSPPVLDENTLALIRAEAARLAEAESKQRLGTLLHGEWSERVRAWRELSDVFGELGELLGLGWDWSLGVLRSQGWLEVMRLHNLIKELPALRALVQTLGRMRTSTHPDAPSNITQVLEQVRRAAEISRDVRSPLVPAETRGIERSGEVSRMLPSEAALLGHPVLKKLWHARRAERGLMTYRVEGVYSEQVQTEEEGVISRQEKKPIDERGPILVCLDTSGSMQGLPELVAKALTLEAMRAALQESRECYLYQFSGPGQVAEQPLTLTAEGLAQLMAFLTMSFHGGTDVAEPLRRAVGRLDEAAWARADILLVSDGAFPVSGETVSALAKAREQKGVRVHGVLIGGGRSDEMSDLCSPVHRFTDWADLANLTVERK